MGARLHLYFGRYLYFGWCLYFGLISKFISLLARTIYDLGFEDLKEGEVWLSLNKIQYSTSGP